MLIDEFMPEFDFNETHEIKIRANRACVFRALEETDLGDSWIIRTLFFLRGLPTSNTKLSDLTKIRFAMLGKNKNEEILLGLVGQFWKVTGNLRKIDAESFREFNEEGFAKAVWNFSLDANGEDETVLRTETRIECAGESARKSFGFYWTLIKPFSGIVRTEILRAVRLRAEKNFQL